MSSKQAKATTVKSWVSALWSNGQLLFLGSLVMLIVSLTLVTIALAIQHSDNTLRVSHVQAPFHANQSVTMGSAVLSVGTPRYDTGSNVFAAPSGSRYMVIDLTVKNISDKPIQVMPSTDVYAKDAAGHVVYLTPFVLAHPFHAGELLPGDTVTGQLSFLVQKSAPYNIYVDGAWSGGVLPFDVTN